MEDLNDIYFFAAVVQHGGVSAAARRIGVEKTRLSRRIAALEKRLSVRLLQRTTRALALTIPVHVEHRFARLVHLDRPTVVRQLLRVESPAYDHRDRRCIRHE